MISLGKKTGETACGVEGDEARSVCGHLDCVEPLVNPIRSGSERVVSMGYGGSHGQVRGVFRFLCQALGYGPLCRATPRVLPDRRQMREEKPWKSNALMS